MYEIGNSLREARVRQGIEFPAAEAGTRIRARYLRAMEEEQFDLLPDPSYVRGFLRAYATFLGLDSTLALDEYESRFGDIAGVLSPEGVRRAKRRAEGRPRRREAQLLWLAIGGVTGVALLMWIGMGGQTPDPPSPVTPTPTLTSTSPASIATVATTSVDVVFTGTGNRGTYVEVRGRDATGPTAYSGVLAPGATRRFAVTDGLWVRIGNPRSVRVALDGRPLSIRGGTGEFLITRTGAKRLPGG